MSYLAYSDFVYCRLNHSLARGPQRHPAIVQGNKQPAQIQLLQEPSALSGIAAMHSTLLEQCCNATEQIDCWLRDPHLLVKQTCPLNAIQICTVTQSADNAAASNNDE